MPGSALRRRARAVSTLLLGVLLVAAWAPAARADANRAQQWYLTKLGVAAAWQTTRGAGVLVGVVDSGVQGSVTDLRGAVVGGKDFSGLGSANGQTPLSSHGTNVASVLAGRGHGDGAGVIGVAPAAHLISASVNAAGGEAGASQIASAVRWLTDQKVKVINISIGGNISGDERAAFAYAQAHDVVLVVSAGNDGAGAGTSDFVTVPGVVGVTGVDSDLKIDPRSSRGTGVAIAGPFASSPTQGIPVADPDTDPAGPYKDEQGTSLAAPIVAGVVALIRAHSPQLNAASVINTLIRTATPRGSGRPNADYGYGVVNAAAAVRAHLAPVTANPLGSATPSTGSGSGSASGTPTGSAGSSTGAPASSAPSTTAPGTAPATSSGASGGGSPISPIGVALIAIVVVALVIAVVAVARRRRRPARPAPVPAGVAGPAGFPGPAPASGSASPGRPAHPAAPPPSGWRPPGVPPAPPGAGGYAPPPPPNPPPPNPPG